jgi:hypothetical protein
MNIKTKVTKSGAATAHLSDEEHNLHGVGMWNLHVLIVPDGKNHYFAQCQEIDYAAQGTSLEEAQGNFEKGFVATLHHHLKMFGSIDKMLEPVSTAEWFELLKGAEGLHFDYEHTSLHHVLPNIANVFPRPYNGRIEYARAMGAVS